MCKAFTSTLGIRHLMPELQMRCSELGFWTCSVLSFAVGLCIFWVKIVDFLYSESDGNFTLSALASCRTRMGKRCGCNNLLHVGPSATVLVILQTLSCGRSTPVQLRLDFQSAASVNTVLELCDQLLSENFCLERVSGRFAAFQLGLLQLTWALLSVCEVERKRPQQIVFASHSLSHIVLSYLHLTNQFMTFQLWDTSCRYLTSDPSENGRNY